MGLWRHSPPSQRAVRTGTGQRWARSLSSSPELVSQLRATLGRLEVALTALADALVWTNEKGQIQWTNAAFDSLVERPHLEILGQPLASILPLGKDGHLLRPEEMPWMQDSGEGGIPTECYEFVRAGRKTVLEVSTVRRGLSASEPTYVCILRDVTAATLAQLRTQELNLQLAATNRELEAFAYSVSHDLRAPLRCMDGFSQAVLEDYQGQIDAKGQDYLRRVRAAAQRMGQLIDDLLRLSRVSRGELRFDLVNLSNWAGQIAAELQDSQPQRHAEFVIQSGCITVGDNQLLRVVFDNLLQNAWKFTSTREHTRIEVGTLDKGATQSFFVRDNGVGFDMAYAGRLFSPFSRLHNAEDFPGTGIGLATVQRIVHRHGGQVAGEAIPNEGATFTITLPSRKPGGNP